MASLWERLSLKWLLPQVVVLPVPAPRLGVQGAWQPRSHLYLIWGLSGPAVPGPGAGLGRHIYCPPCKQWSEPPSPHTAGAEGGGNFTLLSVRVSDSRRRGAGNLGPQGVRTGELSPGHVPGSSLWQASLPHWWWGP